MGRFRDRNEKDKRKNTLLEELAMAPLDLVPDSSLTGMSTSFKIPQGRKDPLFIFLALGAVEEVGVSAAHLVVEIRLLI